MYSLLNLSLFLPHGYLRNFPALHCDNICDADGPTPGPWLVSRFCTSYKQLSLTLASCFPGSQSSCAATVFLIKWYGFPFWIPPIWHLLVILLPLLGMAAMPAINRHHIFFEAPPLTLSIPLHWSINRIIHRFQAWKCAFLPHFSGLIRFSPSLPGILWHLNQGGNIFYLPATCGNLIKEEPIFGFPQPASGSF